MTPPLHPILSAVLGKAKVGGLVLAATVLVAGTAQAASGSDLFGDDSAPVVGSVDGATDPSTEPVDEPTTDPVDDPTTDPVDDPTTDPVDEPTTDPTADPTTDPVDEPTADPTEEGDDPTTDPACTSARNHGAYVSGVAHQTLPGPGHGAAVSAAAHSTCGKSGDAADDSAEPTADATADATDDSSSDEPADSGDQQSPTPTTHTPPGQAKKHDPAASSSTPGKSGSAPSYGQGHGQGHQQHHKK